MGKGPTSGEVTYENDDYAPSNPENVDHVGDAVPKVEPLSKYGNPESYVVRGKRYYVLKGAKGFKQRGIASWYGQKFHGRRTSSGEAYDMYKMTAAHKTLPLPTYVRVKNLRNGKTVIVRANDRGPFHEGRIIDLSYAAAKKLGVIAQGTAPVEIQAIDPVAYAANNAQEPKVGAVEIFYFLQIGAFGDQANANRLKNELELKGFAPVSVLSASGNGKTVHRVRIGPMKKESQVDSTRQRLEQQGYDQHHLVIEP